MDKYIVEIDGKNICSDSDGKSKLALSVKADNGYAVFCTEIPLTPYTAPDLEQVRKEAYQKGYETGYEDGYNEPGKNQQEAYQRGLNDAWEAAKKIANMPYIEEEKAFGSSGWTFINKHTATEAIEKIRQYEQEQDRQARIEYNCEEIKDVLNTTMKECNVSLDDIAEVLAKMRESE